MPLSLHSYTCSRTPSCTLIRTHAPTYAHMLAHLLLYMHTSTPVHTLSHTHLACCALGCSQEALVAMRMSPCPQIHRACAWHQLLEISIEHVGNACRSNLMFAFPQCFPISPLLCLNYPPTFIGQLLFDHTGGDCYSAGFYCVVCFNQPSELSQGRGLVSFVWLE